MQDSLFPDEQPRGRQLLSDGYECPKCNSRTRVGRTMSYGRFIIRERYCTRETCRHVFKTHEHDLNADDRRS